MYSSGQKHAYLKSEIVEIGRFWAISGFFSILSLRKGGGA